MNKIAKILMLVMPLLVFTSCYDEDNIVEVEGTASPVVLNIDTDQIVLDAVDADNLGITLTWEFADYSQPTAVLYEIQASNSETFDSYVTAGSVSSANSISWTVTSLNSIMVQIGLSPFQWGTAYFRVISTIGSQGSLPQTSNVVSLNAYPYFSYLFQNYYLVGNATPDNWSNNANNFPLFRDPDNSDLYYFTGYFKKDVAGSYDNGRFKVLETLGLWQPQWGVSASEGSDDFSTGGTIAGNPGTQSYDPGRFGVDTEGYYTFIFNRGGLATVGDISLDPNTYSLLPYDASSSTPFTSLTLSGSALSADATMTQSTQDPYKWYVNSVHLTTGDAEFMVNGSTSWGSTVELGGVATEGGGAIPVPVEDDYDVWFDGLTGRYIFIPLNY